MMGFHRFVGRLPRIFYVLRIGMEVSAAGKFRSKVVELRLSPRHKVRLVFDSWLGNFGFLMILGVW